MSIGFNTWKCKVKYNRQTCLFFNDTTKLKSLSVTKNKTIFFPKRQICICKFSAGYLSLSCSQMFSSTFFFSQFLLYITKNIHNYIYVNFVRYVFYLSGLLFSVIRLFFPSHPMALISVLKISLFPFSSEFFP